MTHNLTDERKGRRVDWCRFMKEEFNGSKKKTYTMYLSVNKRAYTTTTPKQSDNELIIWCIENEPISTKCHRTRRTQKSPRFCITSDQSHESGTSFGTMTTRAAQNAAARPPEH
ncbi:hypothetical protein EVAR_32976_1 [Eumeta japonica]|uniref:Uncharacterized protein n=1 Tax=Eumeta variegata TaxID=151549 RepID=A0A4C1X065_EUMVA|nr:hypothetical protein EVAR_32976_1 [Eumeta japonica]